MKFESVRQRSARWLQKRVGKVNASNLHRILTPGGKLSAQSREYLDEILAELMLGHAVEKLQTQYMERGALLEDQAVQDFELIADIQTQPGGYATNDAETVGASADRLIGSSGILEIKCGAAWTHVGALREGAVTSHKPQIQGQLWIYEREFASILSYYPDLPSLITPVSRDEPYIKTLVIAVGQFIENLQEARLKLEAEYGPFPEIVIPPPEDESPDFITQDDGDAILANLLQKGSFNA